MSTHLPPTFSTAVALTLGLAGLGCANSHGATDAGGDPPRDAAPDDGGAADAGARTDAGGAADGGGAIDAGGGVDAGTNSCRVDGGGVRVRVEPITTVEGNCAVDELDGRIGALYGVEPSGSGVRLALDMCPTADDDCRCAIHVQGIGADLADRIDPGPSGGLVVLQIEGDRAVVLQGAVTCEPCPEGEECPPCPIPLVLYAIDGSLTSPARSPARLSFEPGTEVCAGDMEDGCYDLRRTVRAVEGVGTLTVEPATVEVDEGETAELADTGFYVRGIRTTGQECAHAFIDPTAAWVAWEE